MQVAGQGLLALCEDRSRCLDSYDNTIQLDISDLGFQTEVCADFNCLFEVDIGQVFDLNV